MKIANFEISQNSSVFIVAEMSANHCQKIDIAYKIIDAAKESGADAIKLQTYTPDTITINSTSDIFKIKRSNFWGATTLYELYKKAYMPWEWQIKLKEYAEKSGLIFFSTPFDESAVDFLESINVPAYKISSFEIIDIPLIEYIASKNKPIILSTGMATFSEIAKAVEIIRKYHNNLILLKCISSYPADEKDFNLITMPHLQKSFNTLVGLSDHSIGNEIAIASVALGAKIIEKHFTIDKTLPSPDSPFSIEPHELKSLVKSIRKIEAALGNVKYGPNENELENLNYRPSIFATKNIKKGENLTLDNIQTVRPAKGLKPEFLQFILNKKAKCNIKKGEPLSLNKVEF